MIKDLLGVVQAAKHSHLLVVFAGEVATTICLLQALHNKNSMKCLTLEVKTGKQVADTKAGKLGANSKSIRKLSFCPLCLYCGSNDLSYLNHVVVAHYNVAYRYGKCLQRIQPTSQTLKAHLKHCEGFLKDEVATSSSDHEPMASTSKESPHHPCVHHMKPNTSSQTGSQPNEPSSCEVGYKKSKKKKSKSHKTSVQDKWDKGCSHSDKSHHK